MASSEYGNFAAYIAGKVTGGGGGGGSTPPADIADGIDASTDIDTILSLLQSIIDGLPGISDISDGIDASADINTILSLLQSIIDGLPGIGTGGNPSADVLTVQGSESGTALPVTGVVQIEPGGSPISTTPSVTAGLQSVTVTASTTSSSFNMTGKLNYFMISSASGTPTLTLQANNGGIWVNTSVTATLGVSAVVVESDTLAKVAGLCGKTTFRFLLSASDTITVAIASRD